jgi:UDP-2,3-diacylglucosamine pyrophosphatase LpxH
MPLLASARVAKIDPKKISQGLDRAFDAEATEEIEIEVVAARLIIFSDHHRGDRDGADDFWRCERAYHGALGHYLEAGHDLYVLGDVEELWEERPEIALRAYDKTLALEAEFHERGRYQRFWGNHDDQWRFADQVEKHLHQLFPGIAVREALRLRVVREGEDLGVIFLVHGHQGTLASDRLAWFSRIFVRSVWRPIQRRLNVSLNTPARDFDLREEHDAAMYAWARSHRVRPVLITGHTHRPVFGTSQPRGPSHREEAEIDSELTRAREAGDQARTARLRAELELVRAAPRWGKPPKQFDIPAYFNTGCCSFGDGDVTGIEIADGEIRLVRWLADDGQPEPKVLVSDRLEDVLATVGGG